MEPLLYFKGFHALQTYRLAHALLRAGRRDFALYLQSRASSVFDVDINPAARIGKGVFIDHAHRPRRRRDDGDRGRRLDPAGRDARRHRQGRRATGIPKIRRGVLIGAGAKVLGNIEVGHCSRVAAGSVVLSPVPHNKTVAGVPARIVGEAGCAEPARSMNQIIAEKMIER